MSDIPIPPPDYAAWLNDVKLRIQSARISAARLANRELILLYWDIGQFIVEKQEALGWGRSVVEQLGHDLRAEYPGLQGFSADNLWRMRQFFREYSSPGFLSQAARDAALHRQTGFLEHAVPETRTPILEQAVPEFLAHAVRELLLMAPWGHHIEIMKKAKSSAARLYYLRSTAEFGWTRPVLLNQLKAKAYERSLAEGKSHNFPLALPEHLAEQAEETLKSSYNLEFLGIGGQSNKDFLSKMSIAYKEARETHDWLKLLRDSKILKGKHAESMIENCDELLKITSSIIRTTKSKIPS